MLKQKKRKKQNKTATSVWSILKKNKKKNVFIMI